MCACVNAIENARDAALPSRYLLHQRRARVSRSGATPVANVTRTIAPGTSRTRSRSAAIGSSTAPVVPDSGAAVERDRIGGGASAAEEPRAIGLPFDRAAEPALDAEDVEGPGSIPRRRRAAAG